MKPAINIIARCKDFDMTKQIPYFPAFYLNLETIITLPKDSK